MRASLRRPRSFIDVLSHDVQIVRLSELPLTSLLFLPDGSMVGVGHCYDPLLFTRTPAGWTVAGKLTSKKKASSAAGGNFANARNMFQAQTAKGESAAAAAADGTLSSAHSFLVCGMQPFGTSIGSVASEFTTSALDGKIAFWTRDELAAAMSTVAIS